MGARQWGRHARGLAHVVSVNEYPDEPAQLSGFVSDLESKARMSLLEQVEESFQGLRLDHLATRRTEIPEHAVKADLDHAGGQLSGRKEVLGQPRAFRAVFEVDGPVFRFLAFGGRPKFYRKPTQKDRRDRSRKDQSW